MRVILTSDLKGKGKRGDVINVNDGYASNYLFPNKLAEPATAGNLNIVNNAKAAEKFRLDTIKKDSQELAKKMQNTTVKMQVKSGESGKIFGSVTSKEIASALEGMGFKVDKRTILLDSPIKATGNYQLTVKLHPEASCKINVLVTSE